MVCASGKQGFEYPFTLAFYESKAYMHYRKKHFSDLMLPGTVGGAAGATDEEGSRSPLLWDARFLSS